MSVSTYECYDGLISRFFIYEKKVLSRLPRKKEMKDWWSNPVLEAIFKNIMTQWDENEHEVLFYNTEDSNFEIQ